MIEEDSVVWSTSTSKKRPPIKWLHVILDINGIMCNCVHPSTMKDLTLRCPWGEGLCPPLETLVGPKAVFTHQRLRDFLVAVSSVTAYVVIWSSMKKSSVDQIVLYLFDGLPYPDVVLSKKDCEKIKIFERQFLMQFTLIFLNSHSHCLIGKVPYPNLIWTILFL